jgi:hypothetical protein
MNWGCRPVLRSLLHDEFRGATGTVFPGLTSLRENSSIWEARGAHRRSLGYPRFPVESCGFGRLHVVLFSENT